MQSFPIFGNSEFQHPSAFQFAQGLPYTQQQPLQILQNVQPSQIYVAPQPIVEVQQQPLVPPDLNWIGPNTKYKTHYVTVPMIKPVMKMVKKVETVMVDEKYWETKWIAVQVTSHSKFPI